MGMWVGGSGGEKTRNGDLQEIKVKTSVSIAGRFGEWAHLRLEIFTRDAVGTLGTLRGFERPLILTYAVQLGGHVEKLALHTMQLLLQDGGLVCTRGARRARG